MFADNPFVVFTVIAAPAVMTNAAAIMSLTTSNRLARAVDRSRALVAELKKAEGESAEERSLHLREVEVARQRAELLIQALAAFQVAFAAFATATLAPRRRSPIWGWPSFWPACSSPWAAS